MRDQQRKVDLQTTQANANKQRMQVARKNTALRRQVCVPSKINNGTKKISRIVSMPLSKRERYNSHKFKKSKICKFQIRNFILIIGIKLRNAHESLAKISKNLFPASHLDSRKTKRLLAVVLITFSAYHL